MQAEIHPRLRFALEALDLPGMGVFGVEDFGDLGVALSGEGRACRWAGDWERTAGLRGG